MPNVLFITPGPIQWASSRYRAYWIAEQMENAQVFPIQQLARGGNVEKPDYAIFIKATNEALATQLNEIGAEIIWDICDPVHWFSPETSKRFLKFASRITASNIGLAEDLRSWSKRDVKVIPDRMKLEHYKIKRNHIDTTPIRFIWYGASQNRGSAVGSMANIERLNANGIPVEVTILDDAPSHQWRSDGFTLYHKEWELEKENRIIAAHDIALTPPYPGPWGNLKSNNKQVTAWACGLPTTDGYDYEEVRALASSATYRKRIADKYGKVVEEYYDVRKSARELEEFLWG